MSALTERAAQILTDAISKREGNRPFCTLALLNDDGFPYTTTISPARCDGVHTVYFCTGLRSPKVALALREPRACMCFNSDDFSISLAGLISVVSDVEERKAA